MKKKIFFGLALLAMAACQTDLKEDANSQQTTLNYTANDQGEIVGEQVVLGETRQNAYSVEIMQAAFDYYNEKYPDSPFAGRKVEATHLYVKILPSTESDLLKLEEISNNNDEFYISEYPMDQEVVQEGSDYTDPDYKGQTEFKPLYTVLPINKDLGVTTTLIEKLYEPTDEEFHVETIALAMAKWEDDLIADFGQAVTMDNVDDFIGAPSDETARSNWFSSLFGRKYTPKGTIKVYNYDFPTVPDPLANANINTGRGLWWVGTHTDDSGYFEASKRYRGKVRIRSAWRNAIATERMTWNEIIGIQVSDHVMTETRGNNNRTYIIMNAGEDERLWCKGAVYNGLVKYNTFCNANGILKVMNSNVWVSKTGKDASTPMMHTYPSLLTTAATNYSLTNNAVLNGIANSIETPVTTLVSIVFKHLLPDQMFNGIKTRGTLSLKQSNKVVEQLVFHESGHFSHALKCGSSTYSLVVGAESKNTSLYSDPYNNGQTPSVAAGKMIALAEGWATYIENRCMQQFYTSSYDNSATRALPGYIESFRMQAVPYTGGRTDAMSWFYTGLMWDITDGTGTEASPSGYYTNNGGTLNNSIVDAVSLGSSPSYIYLKLTSDVTSAATLKTKLTTAYPSQATAIGNLFTSYGQ